MAWTETARRDHARRGQRYSSDLTDREWALIRPHLPKQRPMGRPRTTNLREVMNAILYLASSGCAWSLLPRDFPSFTTVQRYFYDWRDRGLLKTLSHHLVAAARDLEGREARGRGGPARALASSIARASRPRKAAASGAMTQARKSKAASATSSRIRFAISSGSWSMARISGIATGTLPCSTTFVIAILGYVISSPMADTAARNSSGGCARSVPGRSRSSSDPIRDRASNTCRDDG